MILTWWTHAIDVPGTSYTRSHNLVLISVNFLWHLIIVTYIVHADSVCSVWTGGYCCPGEEVSLLACVVKHGYHSVLKYQWYKGEASLDGECYPLLYATMCGVYRCQHSCE